MTHQDARQKTSAVLAVVISYNSAGYVDRAVQSLLRQDYPRLRCAVIDDASTDGTLTLVSRYQGHLEIFANDRNMGFSKNLNKALELAVDEEFLFLQQDDVQLLETGYISKALSHFQDDAVAAVTGQMVPVLDSLTKRLIARHLKLDHMEDVKVHLASWPHLKADLFRVSALREIGGFTYAGSYRLGVEDQIVGSMLHHANWIVLREPNIRYLVDFARCETLVQFFRKEWSTGWCLGVAIALGLIPPSPDKAQIDLARRNHRIYQVSMLAGLLLAFGLGSIDASYGLAALAIVLLTRSAHFVLAGSRLESRERIVLAASGLVADLAFAIPFCCGIVLFLMRRLQVAAVDRFRSTLVRGH